MTEPRTLGGFARRELGDGLSSFWYSFRIFTIATTAVLFLGLVAIIASSPSPAGGEPFLTRWVLQPAILFGLALSHGIPLGALAGCLALFRRWCGVWGFVAVVLLPATVAISLWWCRDWLQDEAMRLIATLGDSMSRHGLKNTGEVLDRMRTPVHALPIAIIFLGILIPYFLKDALIILTDGQVLLGVGYFLLCGLGAVLLGLIPGMAGSGAIASVAFVARMRRRYRDFMGGSGEP